jgi:hypothetical protein
MSRPSGPGHLRWLFVAVIAISCGVIVFLAVPYFGEQLPTGPTVGEKTIALRAERTSLQARADGEARIGLLQPLRIASLLADALAARSEADRERPFERLAADRRQEFATADALNAAVKEAFAHPGEGARQLAGAASRDAQASLERLASADELPLILQYSPRFIPPRRSTGELTLSPQVPQAPPSDGTLPLTSSGPNVKLPPVPTVPRYAPPFAVSSDGDPPVVIEIIGLHLASGEGPRPILTIGAWHGEATVAPERLLFTAPRDAFETEVARSVFVAGSLAVRRGGRTSLFELLFTVLPDRPGSFALDQKVRTTVEESETLVSPEILARGGPGETRTARRCFDPPPGRRFDKERRRVVVVERLGSQDDISDPTLNGGTAEFASDESTTQICLVVTARPTNRTAKAATIARFEATLVHDKTEDRVVQSGIRALDWREEIRLPFESGVTEWKLYIRLFDEIDREYDGVVPGKIPFLKVLRDADGETLILKSDPSSEL